MLKLLNFIANVLLRILIRVMPGGKCSLHKCTLEVGPANSQHGLMHRSQAYKSASSNFFPSARSAVRGIYSMGFHSATTLYCSKCREEEQEWLQANSVDWEGLVDFETIKMLVDKSRPSEHL